MKRISEFSPTIGVLMFSIWLPSSAITANVMPWLTGCGATRTSPERNGLSVGWLSAQAWCQAGLLWAALRRLQPRCLLTVRT